MSVRAKLTAGAATFVMVGGGLGMAGTLTASAATPSCGSSCVSLYTQKYGQHYFVDVYQDRAAAGQESILFQGSNSDPALDFTYAYEGTVNGFYHNYGLVTAAFAHTYGGDRAFEFQYSPYGLGNYPAGHPTDMPRPVLNVQPEKQYSNGTVFDNQEWGFKLGELG